MNNIGNDEIKELTIESANFVWIGLGIGIVAIATIGYRAGSGQGSQAFGAVTVGTGGGILIGAIVDPLIGWAAYTEEYIFQEIHHGYDMSFLK